MSNSKIAIVTGAAHGIGAAITRQMLAQNIRVVATDLYISHKNFDMYDDSRLLLVKTDVKKESSVKQMIAKAIKHFGRIDILVNNAGLVPKESDTFEKTSLQKWNKYIATNLTGPFLCSHYATPHLKKHRGNIVNIASTRALQSEGNHEPYAASKGGLVALTHELAISLGPDVRVNCISPGWINSHNEKLKKTDHSQHPVGRVGIPEDIAHMVMFLISENATFITGQNFIVDGGMTIKMIYN